MTKSPAAIEENGLKANTDCHCNCFKTCWELCFYFFSPHFVLCSCSTGASVYSRWFDASKETGEYCCCTTTTHRCDQFGQTSVRWTWLDVGHSGWIQGIKCNMQAINKWPNIPCIKQLSISFGDRLAWTTNSAARTPAFSIAPPVFYSRCLSKRRPWTNWRTSF